MCYTDQIPEIHMDTNPSPLWKQLLGAIAGAGVALLLYGGYSRALPKLTAWLVVPQAQIEARQPAGVRTNRAVTDYDYGRFIARTQEIYRQFGAAPSRSSVPAQETQLAQANPPPPPAPSPIGGSGTVTQVRMRERVARMQQTAVQETVEPKHTDTLPSSGVGLWFGVVLAGAGAAGLSLRRKMKHL